MKNKEKMLEIIKNKQSGGRVKKMAEPKNDRKNMRKGPKIFNQKSVKHLPIFGRCFFIWKGLKNIKRSLRSVVLVGLIEQ